MKRRRSSATGAVDVEVALRKLNGKRRVERRRAEVVNPVTNHAGDWR
jgi:hypothetical protein